MLLSLVETIYGLFTGSYHRRWDKAGGWRTSVPVISVGNLTVGGNGKTPFVIELIRLLNDRFNGLAEQNRIALLSRGYGRKSKKLCVVETDTSFLECGDEPLLIKRSCPNALVISHGKRVESARLAIERFGARLILLDDGFQHRPLARDVDFVLLDSERPLHNGRLLPAGRLREKPQALARATAFVAVGSGNAVDELARKFGKPVFRATEPQLDDIWLEKPSGKAFLLTGIARPERVRTALERAGIALVGHRIFRDHHIFSSSDLTKVASKATQAGAQSVLTTSKDNVRIASWRGPLPLIEIPHQLTICEPESLFSLLSEVRHGERS